MKEELDTIQLKYEHENNCNFLVLSEIQNLNNDYQITMLNKNKIEHFLRFDIRMINGYSYMYYDISSKQQLTKLFEYGKLAIGDVKAICRSLSETARLSESYMLDLDRILLNPKYMYMDMFDKSLWFIYLPYAGSRVFSDGMKKLFEYILEHFDHSSGKQDIVQLYELYQHILIGDYDVNNLMLLFNEEFQDKLLENKQAENKSIKNVKSIAVEKESTIIESVQKEVMIDEKEVSDKVPKRIAMVFKAIAITSGIYGMLNIFLPQYVLWHLTLMQSFIIIVISAGVYIFLSRIGDKLDSYTKLIKSNIEIPYSINESEIDTTDIRPIVKDINNDKEDYVKSDKINGKVNTNNDVEDDNQWNYTVLLSDYVKSNNGEKNHKLMLKPVEEIDTGIDCKEAEFIVEIEPDSYPFVIGSMKNLSNFVIHMPFISKMHVCIQKDEKNAYFIEDLNSKNGTYINEERVNGRRESPLEKGDILRLGLLSYEVEIS